MTFRIVETIPHLLGIGLDEPLKLGFAELHDLPRVLYTISGKSEGRSLTGVGEASIDFPFFNYDAWDVYHTLSKIKIVGRSIDERESILHEHHHVLAQCPGAFAAFNMALDDLAGKASELSVIDIYGANREGGKALASITFQENTSALLNEITKQERRGYITKLKLGQNPNCLEKSIERDTDFLLAASRSENKYALDFNAVYDVDYFVRLINILLSKNYHFEGVLFIEQPTSVSEGIAGLRYVRMHLLERDIHIPIMADEIFVNVEDAKACVEADILLNFKIQKIGGAYSARRIEDAIGQMPTFDEKQYATMVGGTFPTAIGRTYDQQCASILKYASLPSDGWEPSTEWFKGEKHLINEQFVPINESGNFTPISGFGLGITLDWDKISLYKIADPKQEYRAIRQGKPGQRIKIELVDRGNSGERNRTSKKTYQEVYEASNDKAWDWNL